ncbi:MAG: AtpZ/AtpI family protein [Ardenticatenaceae bacterium]|nr:AtpZ/AtpI family protein [Ardenticatenaceae bacterium]
MNQKQQQQINTMSLIAGVMGQVGCLNIVLVGVALGVGILLDRLLGTKAIFTVLFTVGSVPVALYLTVRIAMTASARVQEQFNSKETEEKTDT